MQAEKIAIVDIEATGANFAEGDRMIQLAAIIIENGSIVAEHSMLLNPEMDIPTHICHLTGITQEQVEGAPTFEKVASLWENRLRDCIFVAHNLAFDYSFLQQSFELYHIDWQPKAMIDTLTLAKIIFPMASGYTVSDLATLLEIPLDNAHDALCDARTTAYILDQMSRHYQLLTCETKGLLARLSEYLRKDESVFFNNYQAFQIAGNTYHEQKMPKQLVQPHKQNQALAPWLIEQYLQVDEAKRFVRVANAAMPIDLFLLVEVVQQLKEPAILVTSQPLQVAKEPFVEWQSSTAFLNRNMLNALQETADDCALNQTEIGQLMALTIWAEKTQTGLFKELNNENQPVALFEKIKTTPKKDDYFYQRYLRRLKAAKVIVAQYFQFNQILKWLTKQQNSQRHYHLLIDNQQHLLQQLSYMDTTTVPISEYFTILQSFIDYRQYIKNGMDTSSFVKTLMSLQKQINQLLQRLLEILSERFPAESKQQVEELVVLSANDVEMLKTTIGNILQPLYKLVAKWGNRNVKGIHFSEFYDGLETIFYKPSFQGEIILSAMHFNDHFYQLKLEKRPITLNLQHLHSIASLKGILLLQQGHFTNQLYEVPQSKAWTTIQLPSLYVAKQTMYVPLGYLPEMIEIQPGVVSISQEKAILQMIEFIQEQQSILHQRLLILTPNKQAVERTYQLLTTKGIKERYKIYAEGIHGKLKRAIRNFQEEDVSIIIVSQSSFGNEWLPITPQETDVLIQSLPFTHPDYIEAQRIGHYRQWTDMEIFNHYLLDKMKDDFMTLIQSMNQRVQVKDFYLFDERLYTKYYSNDCRLFFEQWLNFEIID
ncbi:hypothetical protein I4Q36_05830 [Tuanshanicoccus lijuaniae]|uniref:3'-5' exonuclease n=1 Tax=Aerococcaceae bacterium zg-1292 TaxID=2774330 RepID=UPI001937370D|nr:hypothetical protein [Aerococcaceae bacterium zg-1292]QQA36343.1 hypothetical protein I4Q36_05830 [Aerococcaceae bacterium zg-1292]